MSWLSTLGTAQGLNVGTVAGGTFLFQWCYGGLRKHEMKLDKMMDAWILQTSHGDRVAKSFYERRQGDRVSSSALLRPFEPSGFDSRSPAMVDRVWTGHTLWVTLYGFCSEDYFIDVSAAADKDGCLVEESSTFGFYFSDQLQWIRYSCQLRALHILRS